MDLREPFKNIFGNNKNSLTVNKQTEFFNCNYPEGCEEVQEHYCDGLDDFVIRVCKLLGFDSEKFKYGFNIYNDREEFRKAIGRKKDDFPNWLSGVGDTKRINGKSDRTMKMLTPEATPENCK